jgi:hypothetical protein
MPGYKDFNDGAYLTADEIDDYLMEQVVMRFTTTAALQLALPSGVRQHGMLASADDTGIIYQFDAVAHLWFPISSSEKAWTSTWTGSTTNPNMTSGTNTALWRIVGARMVAASWRQVFGATFNAGSGNYQWSLPVAASDALGMPIGRSTYFDTSASAFFNRSAFNVGSAGLFVLGSEANVRSGAAAPVVPGVGDVYHIELLYRTEALDLP